MSANEILHWIKKTLKLPQRTDQMEQVDSNRLTSHEVTLSLLPETKISLQDVRKMILLDPWVTLVNPVKIDRISTDDSLRLEIRFKSINESRGKALEEQIREAFG